MTVSIWIFIILAWVVSILLSCRVYIVLVRVAMRPWIGGPEPILRELGMKGLLVAATLVCGTLPTVVLSLLLAAWGVV